MNLQSIALLSFEGTFRGRVCRLNLQFVDVGGDCKSCDQKEKVGYETHRTSKTVEQDRRAIYSINMPEPYPVPRSVVQDNNTMVGVLI